VSSYLEPEESLSQRSIRHRLTVFAGEKQNGTSSHPPSTISGNGSSNILEKTLAMEEILSTVRDFRDGICAKQTNTWKVSVGAGTYRGQMALFFKNPSI